MSENHTLKIAILVGSVRPGNYSMMAAHLVQQEFKKHPTVGVDFIDTAQLTLPLPGQAPTPDVANLQSRVRSAAAVVFVTPEYHGSFSSVTKLLIDNLGFPSALGGKPIALLGVAAGAIGAIKSLEHLRSVCSHIGGMVLPLAISVPQVNKVFDTDGKCLDPNIEKVVRGVATRLMDYMENHVCPKLTLEAILRSGLPAVLAEEGAANRS